MRYFVKKNKRTDLLVVVMICVMVLCGCGDANESAVLMQLDETKADWNKTDIPEDTYDEKCTLEEAVKDDIYVYLCGAVKNEGVYEVPEGSRLFEVIELAGGLLTEADNTSFNLAREVTDGEQIVVLTKEESKKKQTLVAQGITNNGLVNINTATVQELTTISGIGESRAQAIINYRENKGKFKNIDDIKKVDGIKDGLFSKIKDKITVQ